MFVERRRERRGNAFMTGTVALGDGRALDCLVWDLSGYGALIEVEPQCVLPEASRLTSAGLQLDRRFRVVWRSGRKAGIEFAA